MFNMYIAGLRQRLESEHPRLCTMMGCIIAILLYADDAAIPADSIDDLRSAAEIAERFFNDSQLYVSTPKTFLTVFHASADDGVKYEGDLVTVDNVVVDVRYYGERIKASKSFKYVGINFDEYGSNTVHR